LTVALISLKLFLATARAPTKSRIGVIAVSVGGEGNRPTGGLVVANQLMRGGGGKTKSPGKR
jgi:hypothetical protein